MLGINVKIVTTTKKKKEKKIISQGCSLYSFKSSKSVGVEIVERG
jgi:hypothetical protein